MNNSKAKFILKNFIKVLLLLFAVSVAAFALMTASPIDPLKANVGQAALGSMSQEQIAKLEEYWGVGQPPLQRYIAWFRDFVRGDMGISLLYRQKVTTVIAAFLPVRKPDFPVEKIKETQAIRDLRRYREFFS